MTQLPLIAKENSTNSKTGMVSCTYVSQSTCPKCPLFKNGCYAESGSMGILTKRVNSSPITDPIEIAKEEAKAIESLTVNQPLRLHVVGDFSGVEGAEIVAKACDVHKDKFGKDIWSYTHDHTIPRKSFGCISILRSCESLQQAKKAVDDGFAAALVVDEFKSDKAYNIGEGLIGIPCPQETKKAKTCLDCKLCMKADKLKNRVILFAAHGARKNTVKRIINAL